MDSCKVFQQKGGLKSSYRRQTALQNNLRYASDRFQLMQETF